MRILVVSDLPHFVTGGAEMQAARLIEAWLDAGHEVTCLGRRMGAGPVTIGRHTIDVRRIHTTSLLGRWGRAASYFVSLAWLLLRHRRWADVIYTRFLGEAAATAALLKASRLLSIPLVATPANAHGAGDTQQLKSLPFAAALIQLLERHCDAINLIAEDMTGELRAAGFSGANFSRIPNGIPVRALPSIQKATPLRFVAVGRLAPQKAYDVLLRALARLRDRLGDTCVWIIGDGPERDRLHSLARELQLDAAIEWLGELSPAEVALRLDAAHAFLLPSRYEGMSNAGLEAMERGLPLVISRCGGLDRYVDAGMGWVVPKEDEAALAAALEQALAAGPERLATMGATARRCVERQFDMQVVGQRYLALFEQLCERNSAPKRGAA
jgi:glycosyltransferase involved in cell wall biosynthesis